MLRPWPCKVRGQPLTSIPIFVGYLLASPSRRLAGQTPDPVGAVPCQLRLAAATFRPHRFWFAWSSVGCFVASLRRRRPRKLIERLYQDLQRWRQSAELTDFLIISLCRPALAQPWGRRVQSDPIVGRRDRLAATKGRQIKCREWNSVMIGPNSCRPRPQNARHQSTPEDWADLRRHLHLLHPASDAGRLSSRHCRCLSDSCRVWLLR